MPIDKHNNHIEEKKANMLVITEADRIRWVKMARDMIIAARLLKNSVDTTTDAMHKLQEAMSGLSNTTTTMTINIGTLPFYDEKLVLEDKRPYYRKFGGKY